MKIGTMITLLTDFGLVDPYVAQMKGVIRTINSQVEIIDISHGIEKYNVGMGSFALETTVPFFPDGTIHIAVVDPGVGGTRLPIVVDCDGGVLVGPDNGLLASASDRLGFRGAFRISNREFVRENSSTTFHGRDLFAEAGAKIALGSKPSDVGPRVSTIVRLDIRTPTEAARQVNCTVLYVDSFGTIVTNISDELAKRSGFERATRFEMAAKNQRFDGSIAKSYSELLPGKIGLLLGSQGYLEIAVREGSAAKKLGIRSSDQLTVHFK
jgi:S-adenosyl-L-methionine hydrolase (adenosine-forming)